MFTIKMYFVNGDKQSFVGNLSNWGTLAGAIGGAEREAAWRAQDLGGAVRHVVDDEIEVVEDNPTTPRVLLVLKLREV